jgi:23S rRNA pseudouridine1911/1915/1917 synthase
VTDPNYPDYIEKRFEFVIPAGQRPERLDVFLATAVANATRTKVQAAIEAGNVTLNGIIPKMSRKIQPGDVIVCTLLKPPPLELLPENIPLDARFEDDFLLVVNKPAGMVTHPGFGNRYGTLVNALLYHLGKREPIPLMLPDDEDAETDDADDDISLLSDAVRPGIVHRLDKNTSGLLVIAKSPEIHAQLAVQFRAHTVRREYNAIVWGRVKQNEGTISTNIGRSPRNRKMFAVVERGGKHAVTHYEVIERFGSFTLVKFRLETGRTHQIRVHATWLGHPLLGDDLYGGNVIAYSGIRSSEEKSVALRCLDLMPRQALHARTLGFRHPVTKKDLFFGQDLPSDFVETLDFLRGNADARP